MSLLSNSKKSKWIIGGVAAFAVIATASTGLASWVITKNGDAKVDGQIKVAAVSDQYLDITDVKAEGNICFGPSSGDNSGMIQATGDDVESLSVTVSGTVTAGADVSWTGLTGTFAVAEATTEATTAGNTSDKISAYNDAISSHYIVAPKAQTFNKPTDFKSGTTDFSMTFTFAWGSAFGEENPSLYFDDGKEAASGQVAKTYASATTVLADLQKLNDLHFVITISATTASASSSSSSAQG